MKTVCLWIIIVCNLIGLNGNVLPFDAPDLLLFPEDVSADNLESYLEDYIADPLIWNSCELADIENLPLSDDLRDRLTALKKQLPEMNSWAEFQSGAQFNEREMQLIKFFIIVEKKQYIRNLRIQHYTSAKGAENLDLSKSLIRGKIAISPRLAFGFVAERDPGEKALWDYQNSSVTVKLFAGGCELGLSAFKFDWGHGLLFAGNNLSFKSLSVTGNVITGVPRFRAYSGADENRFLRGVYIRQRWKRWTLYSCASYGRLDATVQDGEVLSFRETGLHSTDSEIAAKDTLAESTICSGLVYSDKCFLSGILVFQTRYSFPVVAYYERTRQSGFSFYQKADLGEWRFSGELAVLNSGEYAIIQGFVFQTGQYTFGGQYRYFSDNFATRLSSAMKEYSGSRGNEKGVYLGLQCRIDQGNRIGGYVDFYSENRSFDKGRMPDCGTDAVVYLHHRWPAKHFINLRLKREISGRGRTKHQTTVSARCYFPMNLAMSFRGIVNNVNGQSGVGTSVALLAGDIETLEITLGVTQFYTPTYEAGIYMYEPGIPLRFNMVSLYGTGYRRFIVIQKRFGNGATTAISYKSQTRRSITDPLFSKTFLLEFQMLVDL